MVFEVVMGGGEGVISFGFVERGDDVFADVDDGVILDEVSDERLSDVGIGEACDCHHGLDGFGDFWGTDDEGCASCWEAEFGEREDVYGRFVPRRGGIAEHDVWERFAVSMIDEERDAALLRKFCEMLKGCVVNHISARVGGPREADG